jgi:hypothetical protein
MRQHQMQGTEALVLAVQLPEQRQPTLVVVVVVVLQEQPVLVALVVVGMVKIPQRPLLFPAIPELQIPAAGLAAVLVLTLLAG